MKRAKIKSPLESILNDIVWDHMRYWLDFLLVDEILYNGFYIGYEEWCEEVDITDEMIVTSVGIPCNIGGHCLHFHQLLVSSECADTHIINGGDMRETIPDIFARYKQIAPKNILNVF